MKRTKIICTLGPATDDPAVIRRMLKAGMNVARLNLSHGTHAEHEKKLKCLRSLSRETAIIADLQGPRIRTGCFKDKIAILKAGAKIILTAKNVLGDETLIPIFPSSVIRDIKKGEHVFIDGGRIKLRIDSVSKGEVRGTVIEGGEVGEHKGLNLPHSKLSLPSVTAKDMDDLLWGIKMGVDFVALSIVRKASDVLKVKKIIKKKRSMAYVIAKLEKPEAIEDLDEIIKVSDGVMVARGDLGIEMSLAKVPVIQKEVIEKARIYSKPVIIATQMLESMVKDEHPTRAEVSDVANAIFDGADAVMLSEETAIGIHPVEVVKIMTRIVSEAERSIQYFANTDHRKFSIDFSVSHAACSIAQELNAKAIITFTESGSTALRVSKYRPKTPIIGIVTRDETLRKLSLYFGLRPLKIKPFKYIDQMIENAEEGLLREKIVARNDVVVLTAGIPVNIPGTTNLIKVHKIGAQLFR